jgi:hypothetical protein
MTTSGSHTQAHHLNNRHRDTLAALFEHPTSHNVRWPDVVSLLNAVGTVEERREGKVKVTVGETTEFFDPPRDHNAGDKQVVELRRLLRDAGYGPDARPTTD